MLAMHNLSKKIKRKTVLNDLNFSFTPAVYGLLGPNGAGKTTLMRCLTNISSYRSGKITYDGKNIIDNKHYISKLGYLSQKFDLFKELTVREMMEYIAVIKGIDKMEQKDQIEQSVELVNLTERINDKIKTLSGGMIRRLGIAQAILGDPSILIVDEPTAGLDPEERMRFKGLISSIKKSRITIISTHIVEDVEAICDQIIIIREGSIIASGTCEEIQNIANEYVYEIAEDEKITLQGDYYVEKQNEKDGHVYLRVLTKNLQNRPSVAPTVEDGYLWALKWL